MDEIEKTDDKIVILDRDGVINFDSDEFIKTPEEWVPIPLSLEAIAKLNQAGFTVFIASNQSGIARGLFGLNTLEKIHQKMHDALLKKDGKIEKIYFCPHSPGDHCSCRKPLPGMLKQLASDYDISLKKAYVVGDSFRDIEAGLSLGAKTILVKTGNGEKALLKHADELKNTIITDNLMTAVKYILEADKF